jgi:Fe-S cluster assembly protein SufD
VDQPIHIAFVASSEDGLAASHPRVLIVVDEGAQATIVESYLSQGDERYFTNAVTEVVARDGAVVRHCQIQDESQAGFHVATTSAQVGRDAHFSSFTVSTGGAVARSDLSVALAEAGGSCALDGLYLAGGTQHIDNHTAIDHAAPRCASRQLYKGVLGGRARAVFNGKVIVRPGAQKTDAQQTNRNLLLSDEATVDTKPQLEIFADDVKCTHGAAIGQLDEEAVFYLKSRGMDSEQARVMLTQGFAVEVISRLASESVRPPLEQLVLAKLRKGL